MNDIFTSHETKALKELKEMLSGLLGDKLLSLVLFGSRAMGDYDSSSDIDIAVIVRGLSRSLKNRIFTKVAEIELKNLMPMSILVLSEEEF